MKQISVFLEKRKGKLKEITSVLANAGVSIKAVDLVESSDFGILRLIVGDIVRACEEIEKAGFSLTLTDVLKIEIDDEIGALSRVVSLFSDNGIDIEYCYTLNSEKKGSFIFKINTALLNKAKKLLEENSISFE
ncbi:ACT domain-containing protein [Nautilia lithotrophica]